MLSQYRPGSNHALLHTRLSSGRGKVEWKAFQRQQKNNFQNAQRYTSKISKCVRMTIIDSTVYSKSSSTQPPPNLKDHTLIACFVCRGCLIFRSRGFHSSSPLMEGFFVAPRRTGNSSAARFPLLPAASE